MGFLAVIHFGLADEILYRQLRTWIFTFDSLGSQHPQVKKVLNEYLVREARDKKAIEDTTEANIRQASVSF